MQWEQECDLLGASAVSGMGVKHLRELYTNFRDSRQLERDYCTVRKLPPWPGRAGWVTDRYSLTDVLGAGAAGKVWSARLSRHLCARWPAAESQVAVKILDKETLGLRYQPPRQRLHNLREIYNEIQVLSDLGDHPNIIRMEGAYQNVDAIAIVMSLATGGEVGAALAARGSYSEADARVVIAAVAAALLHCHSHGVVHRDVKPANVSPITVYNPTRYRPG